LSSNVFFLDLIILSVDILDENDELTL